MSNWQDNYVPEPNSGCWIWLGAIAGRYGQLRYKNKKTPAHRAFWEASFGKIPNKLKILHKCDVKLCCNPNHLFLGTNQDNTDDMVRKGRQKWPSQGNPTHRTKLNKEVARIIREMPGSQRLIAGKFNISQQMVSQIKAGRRW